MSARPIDHFIPEILLRAKRLAILAQFIETLPEPSTRKQAIMRLYEADIISSESAEALIETYGLEAA